MGRKSTQICSYVQVAALAGTILTSSGARAQSHTAEVRIDQLQPASAASPFVRSEGPQASFDEGVAVGLRLTTDYGFEPLRTELASGAPNVPGESSERAVVAHALLVHAGASFDPLDWLRFDFDMPFAVFETGDDDASVAQEPVRAGQLGVGDLRFAGHAFVHNTALLDVGLGLRVWGPTGTREAYLSGPERKARFEASLVFAGELAREPDESPDDESDGEPAAPTTFFRWGCTLGLAPLFFAGRDGDRVAASCAAQLQPVEVFTVGVEPHVALFSFSDDGLPGVHMANLALQFEPLVEVGFHVGDVTIGIAGAPGIGDAPGMPKGRALAFVQYAAEARHTVETPSTDTDLDGVADAYDACPEAAGPSAHRGCPSKRDLDGDGIVEGDACPDKPGAESDDPRANGCPDRDNDHIADPIDRCPKEPGPDPDGCPLYARLKKGKFVIDPPVVFPEGSAELPNESAVALREMMQTMRVNPKIKQVSVAIGARGSSNKLSDQRAAAVLHLFDEQLVETHRYEVVLDDELPGGKVTVRVLR